MIKLDEAILYDKIYACWLGKNIGGTLGGPVEGNKSLMNLTFYPKIDENGAIENDDLDLQLVNLHAIENYGINIGPSEMGREWAEHVYFPFDEYGYGVTALRLGFIPPFSGKYDNPFTDCMGSPIRSELWGAVAAGDPKMAAYFAMCDAVVDHAGGEGMYGEIFNAAIESLAFVREVKSDDDKISLMNEALEYLPDCSRVKAALMDTVKWFSEGVGYVEIREKILEAHGRANFTDAPQNLAFTYCGFLYGEDFGDGILKAVNLGYDTDCTGATLGALYGILYGSSYIPEKWSKPIGDKIRVSPAVRGFDAPKDLHELTRRTVLMHKKLQLENISTNPPDNFDIQSYVFPEGEKPENGFNVTISYEGSPSVVPGETKTVRFAIKNNTKGRWRISASVLPRSDAFCACPQKSELTLESSEEASLSFNIKNNADKLDFINRFDLIVTRLNGSSPWIEYRAPFTLLRSSHWQLDGINKVIDGTTVRFEDNGETLRTAKAKIVNPFKRKVKLMCSTVAPVEVALNGETVIKAEDNCDYMPAYHRCQRNRTAVLELGEGVHDITVLLQADNHRDAFFTFAVLATHETEEPGAFYRFIDIEVL